MARIQFFLTIRVLFALPLRLTTAMVASLLTMPVPDWTVPDGTTLCRRRKAWAVQIPDRRADGPLNLVTYIAPVSATGSREPERGARFLGDGVWPARRQGGQGRRIRRRA